jgi:hypothetical protein
VSKKFDIYDCDGRRIYMGLTESTYYFYWADSYGFVTKEDIRRYRWQVREVPR